MQTVEFSSFVREAAARKAELEASGKLRPTDDLRNKGINRTRAKRTLLERVEARAKTAGLPAAVSYR